MEVKSACVVLNCHLYPCPRPLQLRVQRGHDRFLCVSSTWLHGHRGTWIRSRALTIPVRMGASAMNLLQGTGHRSRAPPVWQQQQQQQHSSTAVALLCFALPSPAGQKGHLAWKIRSTPYGIQPTIQYRTCEECVSPSVPYACKPCCVWFP